MGKNEGFLTPKAIANRIKAKGLQKLRWYCQMCQKQCRDENGFKCHCSSESHQRQMQIFGSKPGKFLDEFSREFRDTFLRNLKHSHGTKRTYANAVYNDYIKDRHHTHMNATKWTTLSGFCQYLAKAGYCTIDETPKGWYIAYIDKDPATLEKQRAKERRDKAEMTEEERERKRIEKQLKKAKRAAEEEGRAEESVPTELVKQGDEKIAFSLFPSKAKKEEGTDDQKTETGASKKEGGKGDVEIVFAIPQKRKRDDETSTKTTTTTTTSSRHRDEERKERSNDDERRDRHHHHDDDRRDRHRDEERRDRHRDDDRRERHDKSSSRWDTKEPEQKKRRTEESSAPKSKPRSAMEEIMFMEEQKKEKMNRLDYWITPGIVVKVKHKTLANGKYYNEKGVIENVEARYVAHVKMINSGDILKIDQDMLETVLPALGGRVMIVNGAYRGSSATLKAIDVDKFCATLVLDKGPQSGRELTGVEYEDISKVAEK